MPSVDRHSRYLQQQWLGLGKGINDNLHCSCDQMPEPWSYECFIRWNTLHKAKSNRIWTHVSTFCTLQYVNVEPGMVVATKVRLIEHVGNFWTLAEPTFALQNKRFSIHLEIALVNSKSDGQMALERKLLRSLALLSSCSSAWLSSYASLAAQKSYQCLRMQTP